MKVFGMCIDKRVVIGLTAVGLGVWLFAPGAISAALPLLLLAICPLSMVLMMKAMNGMDRQQVQQQPKGPAQSAPATTAMTVTTASDVTPADLTVTTTDAAAEQPVEPAPVAGRQDRAETEG